MTKPLHGLAAAVALVSVVSLGGCGRSDHEVLVEYCRGLAYCGIYDWTAVDVNSCIEQHEHATGTEHEQCMTRELAVCVGNCLHAHGCAVFDQNDPCSCEREDFGCPP